MKTLGVFLLLTIAVLVQGYRGKRRDPKKHRGYHNGGNNGGYGPGYLNMYSRGARSSLRRGYVYGGDDNGEDLFDDSYGGNVYGYNRMYAPNRYGRKRYPHAGYNNMHRRGGRRSSYRRGYVYGGDDIGDDLFDDSYGGNVYGYNRMYTPNRYGRKKYPHAGYNNMHMRGGRRSSYRRRYMYGGDDYGDDFDDDAYRGDDDYRMARYSRRRYTNRYRQLQYDGCKCQRKCQKNTIHLGTCGRCKKCKMQVCCKHRRRGKG